MTKKLRLFAHLFGYAAIGCFSLFGLMTFIGSNVAASANAAFNQTSPQFVDNPTVPTAFNYQGTLRDSDGNIIETGEYNLTFKIYPDIGTPNALFTQEKSGVIVRDGRFSVTLDNIPNSVFTEGQDRFIGVTVEPFAEMVPRERLSSVPYAVQAEKADVANSSIYGAIPVGGVVDWFEPNANAPLPDGYALCDGSMVEGVQLPNLNGRFAYGTTVRGDVGSTGGSATHSHEFAVPDHTHSYDVNHDHSPFTATTDAIPPEAYFGFGAANEPLVSEASAYWHVHTVQIDIPAYAEAQPRTTGNAEGDNANTESSSSLPPYVKLLKICRYK